MRLLVPAYGYPTDVPGLWTRLCQGAGFVEAVILNVHNGPGRATDPNYEVVIARLRDAGAPMAGYVDLGYGLRSSADVLLDARAWTARYGIETFFLDQAPSTWTPELEQTAHSLRFTAATRLLANPGTSVGPAVARLFDLVVRREHSGDTWPDRAAPDSGGAWILHSTPESALPCLLRRASSQGLAAIWVTDLDGPNPYRALPSYWDRLVNFCLRAAATPDAPKPGALASCGLGQG